MKLLPTVPLALAAALALPLAAATADPLSVFQPTQVRAISVTPADARALQSFPPLEAFGTVRGTRSPGLDEVASASEAAQDAGLRAAAAGDGPGVASARTRTIR